MIIRVCQDVTGSTLYLTVVSFFFLPFEIFSDFISWNQNRLQYMIYIYTFQDIFLLVFSLSTIFPTLKSFRLSALTPWVFCCNQDNYYVFRTIIWKIQCRGENRAEYSSRRFQYVLNKSRNSAYQCIYSSFLKKKKINVSTDGSQSFQKTQRPRKGRNVVGCWWNCFRWGWYSQSGRNLCSMSSHPSTNPPEIKCGSCRRTYDPM